MDLASALIRLLIASALGWLAFWGWRYTGCIHVQGVIFFCPNASGEALVRTNALSMAAHLLAPPLAGLAISFWIWRSQRLARD